MLFVICTPFDDGLYLNQIICKHVFSCFQILIIHDCYTKNTKGHNSNKNVVELMLMFFCASTDDTLYSHKTL